MSVINKMLRDLDKRGQLSARGLELPQVEGKPTFRDRANRGLIAAVVAVVSLAAAGAWFSMQPGMPFWNKTTATPAPVPAAPVKVVVATPKPLAPPPEAAPQTPAAGVATSPAPASALPTPVTPGVYPNVAEIEAAKDAAAKAQQAARLTEAAVVAAKAPPVPTKAVELPTVAQANPAVGQATPAVAAPSNPNPVDARVSIRPAVSPAPLPPPVAAKVTSSSAPAKVAAAPAPTVRARNERAAENYGAAQQLLGQGRMDAAIDSYSEALRLDPGHVPARQALVALLLDRGQVAQTLTVLRDGLAEHPGNLAWATLLARLQVQGDDLNGALATLDKALPYATDRPEFHGFIATLLQMQSRHKDAIAHYEIAVRLAQDPGRWLLGLAMSFEQDKRPNEARDAYQLALSSNTLGPDQRAFVDRKLKQWQ